MNEFQTENGVTRNSDGLQQKGTRKSKRTAYKGVVRQQHRVPRCKMSLWKMPAYRVASMESKAPARHPSSKDHRRSRQAESKHSAKQGAAFMEAWKATREASMQPRDDSAPTAKQRPDALRARVVGRVTPWDPAS